MNKYEIIMYWSCEDDCFIAEVPELPGCVAHGKNEDESLRNIKNAQALWLETAKEFNQHIPEPKGKLEFA